MNIYEIKSRAVNEPYFFSRHTMKCFGQTLKDFKVKKEIDGRYKISAPMRERESNKYMGETIRYFNPTTNRLE